MLRTRSLCYLSTSGRPNSRLRRSCPLGRDYRPPHLPGAGCRAIHSTIPPQLQSHAESPLSVSFPSRTGIEPARVNPPARWGATCMAPRGGWHKTKEPARARLLACFPRRPLRGSLTSLRVVLLPNARADRSPGRAYDRDARRVAVPGPHAGCLVSVHERWRRHDTCCTGRPRRAA